MKFILFFLSLFIIFTSCQKQEETSEKSFVYQPVDQKLHDEIVAMDDAFFTAYNTCDLETAASLISEDIEFFHDMGGLNTSKVQLMNAQKENICGKVTRELIEGSIEVSPIPGYGAVQIGLHQFHNKLEPDAMPKPSRFVTIWGKENDKWIIKRVISLH